MFKLLFLTFCCCCKTCSLTLWFMSWHYLLYFFLTVSVCGSFCLSPTCISFIRSGTVQPWLLKDKLEERPPLSSEHFYWNLPIMFPCKWIKDCSFFKSTFTETFLFPCKWTKDCHSFESTFTDTFLLYFHVNEPRTITLLSQLLLSLSFCISM